MNGKLKKVIEKVSKLPDADQAHLAAVIEEELASEANWQEAFEASQPQLKRLADEAAEEYRAGLTEPLDPDAL